MVTELWQWFRSLSPEFLFLLSLPLIVAAGGLVRFLFDSRKR